MGKYNREHKKQLLDNRRLFLLSFFEEDQYEEKEVNGWWLVKQWDGNKKDWTVFLYSQESYKKYKNGQDKYYEMTGGLLDEAFERAMAIDDELERAVEKKFENWPRK